MHHAPFLRIHEPGAGEYEQRQQRGQHGRCPGAQERSSNAHAPHKGYRPETVE